LLEGTTAPEMMLFPYIREPATGSRMPSMSTGGAAIKATMKQIVAASNVGIIRVPNQPTYKRLFVEVTHSQNDSQVVEAPERRVAIVAVICFKKNSRTIREMVEILCSPHP